MKKDLSDAVRRAIGRSLRSVLADRRFVVRGEPAVRACRQAARQLMGSPCVTDAGVQEARDVEYHA